MKTSGVKVKIFTIKGEATWEARDPPPSLLLLQAISFPSSPANFFPFPGSFLLSSGAQPPIQLSSPPSSSPSRSSRSSSSSSSNRSSCKNRGRQRQPPKLVGPPSIPARSRCYRRRTGRLKLEHSKSLSNFFNSLVGCFDFWFS